MLEEGLIVRIQSVGHLLHFTGLDVSHLPPEQREVGRGLGERGGANVIQEGAEAVLDVQQEVLWELGHKEWIIKLNVYLMFLHNDVQWQI